jgi:Cof subfamily protein (haloacid dehalogenase superfamily)
MIPRLLICDIDGTLLGPDLDFSPRVRQAIQDARSQGTVVALATGRGFPSASRFAQDLGLDTPLICYQGAEIRFTDGKTLHQATLSRTFLPQVIQFCHSGHLELSVYYEDQIYQSTRLYDQEFYDLWFSLPIRQVDDLVAALPGDPIKFIVTTPTEQEGDQVEAQVRDMAAKQFQVMRSHAWFVEGLDQSVSKGNAVALLAEHLGIAQVETMAIGDSQNDASMIEWAHLGIAIGNASPRVQSIADIVAPPQHEDGAAWAIEKFILGKNS